jgi:hypothetical protein
MWFLPPVLTSFTLGAGPGPLLIAGANPQRVGLIVSQSSGPNSTVAPSQNVAIGNGIFMNNTTLPVAYFQSDWGNLVSVEWYAAQPNAGAVISVIEVLLRDWPH